MADQFLLDQIEATERQILAHQAAVDAFTDPSIKTYDLDTGQTQQRVTRQDLDQLESRLDTLLVRRNTLRVRCGLERGQHTGAPGY